MVCAVACVCAGVRVCTSSKVFKTIIALRDFQTQCCSSFRNRMLIRMSFVIGILKCKILKNRIILKQNQSECFTKLKRNFCVTFSKCSVGKTITF